MPSRRSTALATLFLPLTLGLLAAGLLLSAAHAAHADMAPFPAQEGNSLGPAAPTTIQMISETVLIEVTEITKTFGDTVYAFPAAKVVADFAMRNPGQAPETLQVGFPLQVPSNASQAGDYVKITNLAAFVDGAAVETHPATVGSEIWSAWQMSFAPDNTAVRVTYDLPVTADSCTAELGYVLHTGAAWAGPIGQADLIVRYPYVAETTFISPKGVYLDGPTPGYQVEGTDLHWHYDSLEPTAADDLAITFVAPECWRKVAAARTVLNQNTTAENYWHLATAYADIVFPHHGFYSPLIAQVAEAQYQKALSLDPANPQINGEYAQFLIDQVGGLLPATRKSDEIRQCEKALLLAPADDPLPTSCGSFLEAQLGDPDVSANAQATAAAVLTAVSQATAPANATALAGPTVAPTTLPSATLYATRPATVSPTAVPFQTASPGPNASSTPVAVAQVATIAPSTPAEQSGTSPAWAIGFIVLAGLILVAGGVYFQRQRHTHAA